MVYVWHKPTELATPFYSVLVSISVFSTVFHSINSPDNRLIFTWWGCCGLCLFFCTNRAYPLLFICSCVYFCLYGPFNCISFRKFSPKLCAFTLFFRSYFYLTGPFNYMSLYESLLQPWHRPLTNQLTHADACAIASDRCSVQISSPRAPRALAMHSESSQWPSFQLYFIP